MRLREGSMGGDRRMFDRSDQRPVRGRRAAVGLAASFALSACVVTVTGGGAAQAAGDRSPFIPGDLLLSRVHYAGYAGLLTPGVTVLPTGAVAISDGSFA